MMEAVEAFSALMPDKMKKLARAASTIEKNMSQRFSRPELSRLFTDPASKITIGRVMSAVTAELIKRRLKGETFVSIFWSIAYTSPQVTAAEIAKMNPTFFMVV